MSTRIRMARYGAKKRPFYRIIVTDQRSPSGRRSLDMLGTFDPRADPEVVALDGEKLRAWLERGAQPTDSVQQLIKRSGVLAATSPEAAPSEPQVSEESPA